MITIETERLILRAFQEGDAPAVFAYAQSPLVGPAAGWQPHLSVEESEKIVRMFIQEDEVWAVVEKESGQLIGSIGLHKDIRRPNVAGCRSLGYTLGESAWGKGYGTEAARAAVAFAFDTLHAPLVSVGHFPSNTRSKRVIEKCGFVLEGTFRMASMLFSGQVTDLVCYSITRDEYLRQKA